MYGLAQQQDQGIQEDPRKHYSRWGHVRIPYMLYEQAQALSILGLDINQRSGRPGAD